MFVKSRSIRFLKISLRGNPQYSFMEIVPKKPVKEITTTVTTKTIGVKPLSLAITGYFKNTLADL